MYNIVSYFKKKKEEKMHKNEVIRDALIKQQIRIGKKYADTEIEWDETVRYWTKKYPFLSHDHIDKEYAEKLNELKAEFHYVEEELTRHL